MRSLAAFVLCFACFGHAAEFCATTSAELTAALSAASNNNQDDVIRVATGTYLAPTGGFILGVADGRDVAILGGWSDFFGNPCGQRLTSDPLATVLDGDQTNRVFLAFPDGIGSLTFDLLTFRNGRSSQPGAGLEVLYYVAGFDGDVTITNNVFESNRSDMPGGGFAGGAGDNGVFVMRNNVLRFNFASTAGAASINTSAQTLISNNTVAYNFVNLQSTQNKGSANGALWVRNNMAPEQVLIVNNIFWGNEIADIEIANLSMRLRNNLYGALAGFAPGSGSSDNIINRDPLFDSGGPFQFGLRLKRQSPAVDSGHRPFCLTVPLTIKGDIVIPCDQWELEDFDLDGLPRIIGPQVDMGAYENDVVFDDAFEPQGLAL